MKQLLVAYATTAVVAILGLAAVGSLFVMNGIGLKDVVLPTLAIPVILGFCIFWILSEHASFRTSVRILHGIAASAILPAVIILVPVALVILTWSWGLPIDSETTDAIARGSFATFTKSAKLLEEDFVSPPKRNLDASELMVYFEWKSLTHPECSLTIRVDRMDIRAEPESNCREFLLDPSRWQTR